MAFRKAERRKAKLRLGLAGPAGSGKTYSALKIAFGIGGKIAVIDTENGSADLYAHLGEYDVCTIEPPYTVNKYLDAIREAEQAGYDTLIVDSLTHAWAGEGGLLDQKGAIEKRTGNGWTAWRDISPQHNRLVEAMLQSKCHIIATLRAKMEYVQQKDEKTGKTKVEKIGMGVIQREGMDYEFTVMFDMAQDHTASSTKDRTSMFDGLFFTPDERTGKKLLEWLELGIEAPDPSIPNNEPAKPLLPEGWESAIEQKLALKDINDLMKQSGIPSEQAAEFAKKITGKPTSSKELTKDQLDQLKQAIESYKPITFDDLDLDAGNVDDMFPSTSMGAAQ